MSQLLRVFSMRRLVGIAALAGVSPAAFAAQSLVLAFSGPQAVPIGSWTSVMIAVAIAACALLMLRRGGASRFAQWCLLIGTSGVLAVIPLAPEANAEPSSIPLVTSPVTVSPVSCPLATNTLQFQNATGQTTTIQSIQLLGSPTTCSLGGAGVAASVPLEQPSSPCSPGLAIPNGGFCYVTIYNVT